MNLLFRNGPALLGNTSICFISKLTAGLEHSLLKSAASYASKTCSRAKEIPHFYGDWQSNQYPAYSFIATPMEGGKEKRASVHWLTQPLLLKSSVQLNQGYCFHDKGKACWLVSSLETWITALFTNKLALFQFCIFFINQVKMHFWSSHSKHADLYYKWTTDIPSRNRSGIRNSNHL